MSQGGGRRHPAFHMTPDLPQALGRGRERACPSWFRDAAWRLPGAIGPDDVDG
jgi:hypothetical protein